MRNEYDDDTMDRARSRGDRYERSGRGGSDAFGWDRDRQDRGDRNERNSRSAGYRDDDRRRHEGRHRDDGRPGRGRLDPRFGPDAYREGMPRNETDRLIASSKVEGTPVYDVNGRKLGSICTLMLDKHSGQTAYAVLKSSGGFLGLNESYYPIDWEELTYDTRVHGYGVEFTENDLERRQGYDVMGRRLDNR